MQTFKATIVQRNGINFVSVPATEVKIHPKFKTFVHRDPRYHDSNLKNSRYFAHWNVSEETSGATVTTGVTRKAAIENAKNKINEVGIDGMNIAIKSFITRYNLV